MNSKLSDPTSLVFQLFNEIGIINQLTSAELQRVLGTRSGSGSGPGLGQSEFMVLNHFVRVGDGTTPSRLARIFQLTKPSMTAILAKLEVKKLVSIVESAKDRRQKIVTITEAGRRARDNGVAAVQPMIEQTIREFGVERLAEILPVLIALREYADTRRNERDGLG